MKVELSEEAETQVAEIDTWWRANRDKAPNLFAEELEHALGLLEDVPSLGVSYDETRQVRRLLLKKTGHHVYFTESPEMIFVVAVWSARRRRGPPLPKL